MHLIVGLDPDFGNGPGPFRLDRNLHLHRFQNHQDVAGGYDGTDFRRYLPHVGGHLCFDFAHVRSLRVDYGCIRVVSGHLPRCKRASALDRRGTARFDGGWSGSLNGRMRLAGFAVALGLVAGLVGGGSLRHLRKFELRASWLGALWVLGSIAATQQHGTAAVVMLFAATIAGASLAAVNALRWPGFAVVAVGLALNALVLGLNGGLPYDPAAAESAGLVASGPVFLKTDGLTRPFRDGDQLLVLARRVPFAPLQAVTSVGDLLLALGLGLATFSATTDRGKARPHRARHGAAFAGGPAVARTSHVASAIVVEEPRPSPLDVAMAVADASDDPVVLMDLTTADLDDPHLASELTARAAVRAVLAKHGLPSMEQPVGFARER